MPIDDNKKSDLKKYGISIQTISVKMTVKQKDLEKKLVQEIGDKIKVKIDTYGKDN